MSGIITVKLRIPAGRATPQPPVGQILGQYAVNLKQFCDMFNEQSKAYKPDTVLPVKVFIRKDKSFTIKINTPPVTSLVKKVLRLEKGSTAPVRQYCSTISLKQIYAILKLKGLLVTPQNINMVIGTLRSMGIKVWVNN
uniref:Ribosomal protein L11 n=1 Tax=Ancoracysta twista TaxID=2044563 RepID=A0A2H4R8G1_9EUKA|nr:ribosomal protein L11 [Ancoracysta twista]ATY40939.1 ribosomal protein L11 [Ancoracysta twista]